METLGKDGKGLPPDSVPDPARDVVENDTEAERNPITDSEGLRRAYESESGLYLYGDQLYVAGTRGLHDVLHGWPRIAARKITDTERYKDALELLKSLPFKVKGLVGHSYGGSTAAELGRNYGIMTRTYGSPSYTRGNFLERAVGGLVEPFADAFGATAGAVATEFGAPEIAPFVMNAGRDFVKNIANRLESQLPIDSVPKYVTRFKRPYDPVASLDTKARVAGDNRFNQHSSDGWNMYTSAEDVDPRCMIDEKFCAPIERRKFAYRKNPFASASFFRR